MAKISKRFKKASEGLDPNQSYSVEEAVSSFDLHMSDRAFSERHWTDSRHMSANDLDDSSVFSFYHAEAREIGEFHEKAG